MNTPVRIYRTADGALVREGDERAVVLAYGEGDPVENRDQDAVAKMLAKPADKQVKAPANKGAAKSGAPGGVGNRS